MPRIKTVPRRVKKSPCYNLRSNNASIQAEAGQSNNDPVQFSDENARKIFVFKIIEIVPFPEDFQYFANDQTQEQAPLNESEENLDELVLECTSQLTPEQYNLLMDCIAILEPTMNNMGLESKQQYYEKVFYSTEPFTLSQESLDDIIRDINEQLVPKVQQMSSPGLTLNELSTRLNNSQLFQMVIKSINKLMDVIYSKLHSSEETIDLTDDDQSPSAPLQLISQETTAHAMSSLTTEGRTIANNVFDSGRKMLSILQPFNPFFDDRGWDGLRHDIQMRLLNIYHPLKTLIEHLTEIYKRCEKHYHYDDIECVMSASALNMTEDEMVEFKKRFLRHLKPTFQQEVELLRSSLDVIMHMLKHILYEVNLKLPANDPRLLFCR